jgi:hypothetical protein
MKLTRRNAMLPPKLLRQNAMTPARTPKLTRQSAIKGTPMLQRQNAMKGQHKLHVPKP